MIKNNPRIKNSISLLDRVLMTKEIVDCYFTPNTITGEKLYTPYYSDIAFITSFYTHCVEGIEFGFKLDENDEVILDEFDNPVEEDVYDTVIADKEVFALFEEYKDVIKYTEKMMTCKFAELVEQLDQVIMDVNDIVEFEKQKLIHCKKDSLAELVDVLSEKVKQIDISKFDPSRIMEFVDTFNNSGLNADSLVSALLNSDDHAKQLEDATDFIKTEKIKVKNDNVDLKKKNIELAKENKKLKEKLEHAKNNNPAKNVVNYPIDKK